MSDQDAAEAIDATFRCIDSMQYSYSNLFINAIQFDGND